MTFVLWPDCWQTDETSSFPCSLLQERESELAQIRNRFQKGNNIWKIKDEEADTKRNTEAKVGGEVYLFWPRLDQTFMCRLYDGWLQSN